MRPFPPHLETELDRLWRPDWAPHPLPAGITAEMVRARSRHVIWRHAPLAPFRHALRYAAGWYALGIVRQLVANAPDPFPTALVTGLANLMPLAGRRRIAMARKNIAIACPDADDETIDRILAGYYAQVVRALLETLRMETRTPAELREKMPVTGIAHLETALREGNGAICITAHFGPFPLGFARLAAEGVPIAVLVRRQKDRVFDGYWKRLRDRFGVRSIPDLPGRSAVRIARAHLDAGGVLYVAGDQRAPGSEPLVPLFGRPAHTYSMPARLARRTGAKLLPAFVVESPASGRSGFAHALAIEPPLKMHGDVGVDADATARAEMDLLGEFHARLEAVVRQTPSRWWWFHDRFRRYDA